MILLLWLLGILIVAMLIRQLLLHAPKNGKPFLLRVVIIVIIIVAIAFAIKGLLPVSASLLGGLLLYAKPVLNALGLWKTWSSIKNHREQNKQGKPSSSSNMDKKMARGILGVSDTATEQEIIVAYKTLMAKNHPDKGGSDYIATQINQAKEVLLGK